MWYVCFWLVQRLMCLWCNYNIQPKHGLKFLSITCLRCDHQMISLSTSKVGTALSSIRKLTAKFLGLISTLCLRSILYASRAEWPTANTTASNDSFWSTEPGCSLESETTTPLTCPPSTTRSSTLVLNLMATCKTNIKQNTSMHDSFQNKRMPKRNEYRYVQLTPNSLKWCLKLRSRGTSLSVPKWGFPSTKMLGGAPKWTNVFITWNPRPHSK